MTMRTRDRVVYTDPGGRGWATVERLAELLAFVLDAELVRLSTRPRVDKIRRAAGQLPRRRSAGVCVVIAPQPAHLGSLLTPHYLLRGYEHVAGWVVDSFLDDRIPRMAKGLGHYDHLFITDLELVGLWAERTATPTSWLPFGSNVLDQPAPVSARPVDILRVGRQPISWDDDVSNETEATRQGLVYASGPPLLADAAANQASLTAAMRSAKFTLSFTNLASPAEYTHPTRDYVTGRWTDALGAGAAVAGIPPSCEAGQRLLWDEGLVRLDSTSRTDGLEAIAAAVAGWQPEHAVMRRLQALETLDWRHRFLELTSALGLQSTRLADELERLELAGDRLRAMVDSG